jgi:hypothetical protein
MKEAHLQGITPILMRTAARYAALGVGEYTTADHRDFNRVVVAIILPWQLNPERLSESCLVLRVEFFQGDVAKRYAEFRVAFDGFSGEPIMKLVPTPKDEKNAL